MTITERAKEIYRYSGLANTQISSYVRGAAEQKVIDDDHLREVKKMLINRAYSWLVHNLDDDRAFVVWRDFKKFMMEE